jgi:hypothetical protein
LSKKRSEHHSERKPDRPFTVNPKRIYELVTLQLPAPQPIVYATVSRIGKAMKLVDPIHRKLRGLAAVVKDAAATEHEQANATALKTALEKKLGEAGVPIGHWTDLAFRFGRMVREIKTATSPSPPISGTSKIAFRLGRALRQGLKKWRST